MNNIEKEIHNKLLNISDIFEYQIFKAPTGRYCFNVYYKRECVYKSRIIDSVKPLKVVISQDGLKEIKRTIEVYEYFLCLVFEYDKIKQECNKIRDTLF